MGGTFVNPTVTFTRCSILKTAVASGVDVGMHRIAICIILQEPEPEPDIWILVAEQLIFVFTVCYE